MNNEKPETVKIEIELLKSQYDFIVQYSKISNKCPERLFNRFLVAGIHDTMGKVKQLPYFNLKKSADLIPSGEKCVYDEPNYVSGAQKHTKHQTIQFESPFERFLKEYYWDSVRACLISGSGFLEINFDDIKEHWPSMAQRIIDFPYRAIYELNSELDLIRSDITLNFRVRIINLPLSVKFDIVPADTLE